MEFIKCLRCKEKKAESQYRLCKNGRSDICNDCILDKAIRTKVKKKNDQKLSKFQIEERQDTWHNGHDELYC